MKSEIKQLPGGRISISLSCSTCEGSCTVFLDFEDAKKLSWELQHVIESYSISSTDPDIALDHLTKPK